MMMKRCQFIYHWGDWITRAVGISTINNLIWKQNNSRFGYIKYGGAEYLTNKRAAIDVIIGISGIIQNILSRRPRKLNDFGLGFDGWFKMNEKDFGNGHQLPKPWKLFQEHTFACAGMYSKDFDKVEPRETCHLMVLVKEHSAISKCLRSILKWS